MNISHFPNGFHHLLNHNLNLEIIHFHCFVQIPFFPCVFKLIKFPVFFLFGKNDNQIPCAVATL